MTAPVPGLLFDTTFASAPGGSRSRSDVPEAERWHLADIFPSWEAWREAYDDLGARVQAYAVRKGTLGSGPAALLGALRESDTMGQLAYKVWYFASLTHDEDQRDNQIGARRQQVQLLFAQWRQSTAWFSPELLAVPLETLRGWMAGRRGPGHVPVHDREPVPPAGARARREGRAPAVAGRPAHARARRGLRGTVDGGRALPDHRAEYRRERSRSRIRAIARCSRPTVCRPTARGRSRRITASSRRRSTPTRRCTTASCSATGTRPGPVATRPRSRPRCTATTSRSPWSRT